MKYPGKYLSILILLVLFLFTSCNKEEKTPAYIRINSFTLSTDYSTQGSTSHKITDAWVYVDDKTIGVFELPVTIPVLFEGNHEIKIGAGIKNNGLSEERIIYPFYDYYTTTTSLVAEKITTINPVVAYKASANFLWKEDFEGAGFSIIDTNNTDTVMMLSTTDVFEGSKSGLVNLDATKITYIGASTNFVLPQNGAQVYLELNYKSNNVFSVGVYSSNNVLPQPLLFINPSETWKKIYIHLTPIVSGGGNTNPFKIYIGMQKDASVSAPQLLVDNIKLVTF